MNFEAMPTCSVALTEGAVRLHTGIAFRDSSGAVKVLHLASHHKLRCEHPSGSWSYVIPVLDQIQLSLLAGFCYLLAQRAPTLPYGLHFDRSAFDDEGRFIAGPTENGLTCSTLVLAIFEWATIPLLLRESWQVRDDDVEAQHRLVEFLRGIVDAAPSHIAAIEREIGCVRFRPEEVAGATTAYARPIRFLDAQRLGAEILAEFDKLMQP